MTGGQLAVAAMAGIVLLAGCNQTPQARRFDGEAVELAQIRQWQAEAASLPDGERGRYLAERMAGLLPDDTLNACPPRR